METHRHSDGHTDGRTEVKPVKLTERVHQLDTSHLFILFKVNMKMVN